MYGDSLLRGDSRCLIALWLTRLLLGPVALAVACRDVDVRNVKALIIGPHDTPYEFGFFEVRNLLCRPSRSLC